MLRARRAAASSVPLRRHYRVACHPGCDPRHYRAGGRPHQHGVAAETLGAKWFDKSPAFDDDQNLDQLRQSLALAIDLYRARGWSTPFGLYAGTYADQHARGVDLGLVPLVACYGSALLDRAILDALGRARASPLPT